MSLKTTLYGVLTAATLATSALAEIQVQDPYARSSNIMAGAAFMVIQNTGDTDDRLISVTSDAAKRVELHTHIEDADGLMQMIHVEDGFVLPASGEIALKRGSDHIMFMGLNAPFEQDDIITITLTFEQAGEVTVEIPVDQDRVPTAMDHSSMDHGEMDHSDMDHSDMDHGSDS